MGYRCQSVNSDVVCEKDSIPKDALQCLNHEVTNYTAGRE
jgi:hypothetical protein